MTRLSLDTGLKFLVFGDFESLRRILRALLREIGWSLIEEADNGVSHKPPPGLRSRAVPALLGSLRPVPAN